MLSVPKLKPLIEKANCLKKINAQTIIFTANLKHFGLRQNKISQVQSILFKIGSD